MAKIPKNLSDKDMIGNYQDKVTFETDIFEDQPAQKPVKQTKDSKDFTCEFFTPELQEKVGKALLELKVKLFKEGIIDFNIKVTSQENQVILTAVPSKKKSK